MANSVAVNECKKKIDSQEIHKVVEVNVRSDSWKDVLEKLHSYLTSYAVQSDKTKYVNELKQFESEEGLKIDESNAKKFFDQVEKNEIKWNEYPLNDFQLGDLNRILDLTLNQKSFDVKCIDDDIIVTGYCISIKQLKSTKLSEGHCANKQEQKFKSIKVFGLNSIFIDDNIDQLIFQDQKEMLPLVFIAPKWGLHAEHIHLKGLDGDHYEPEDKPVKIGLDGLPGLPGKPGGNFFGVVDEVEGDGNLSIISYGGNGGKGEDGSIGKKGKDGKEVLFDDAEKSCKKLCKDGLNNKVTCKETTVPPASRFFGPNRIICRVTRDKDPGEKGGNGGDGGVGGKGGLAGLLELVSLGTNSKIETKTVGGSTGNGGSGGQGGPGGYDVPEFGAACLYKGICKDPRGTYTLSSPIATPTPLEYHEAGAKGKDNSNAQNIIDPENPVWPFKKAIVINEYKAFVRDNLKSSYDQTQHLDFIKKLEENPAIKNFYDSLALVDDFKKLEDQFYNLNKDVDFIPLYRSLRSRISEYSLSKNLEDNPKEQRFFRRLYSAVLQKENNIEDVFGDSFITNIRSYLHKFKTNYIDPKNDKEFKIKVANEVIKSNTDYTKHIQKEINTAKKQIQQEVQVESKEIQGQIESDIDALVKDINDLKVDTEKNYRELKEKESSLKTQLWLSWIGSLVDYGCGVASGLGPIGMGVGLVVGTGKSIISGVGSDQPLPSIALDGVTSKLPDNIDKLKSTYAKRAEKRLTGVNELLDYSLKEIEKHPDPESHKELTDWIENKMKEIEDYSDKDKASHKKIVQLETEVKGKYDEFFLGKKLPEANVDAHERVKENIKGAMEFLGAGVKIKNAFMTYSKGKNDVGKEIKTNRAALKKLNEALTLIDTDMAPDLNKIYHKNIASLTNVVGNGSILDMDRFKRATENVLANLKGVLVDHFSKFPSAAKLTRCIEKFERLLPSVVKTNDYINSLREKELFGNYVKDLSLATSADLEYDDPELDRSYKELEVKIYSNFILQQYDYFMNTFRQNTFPKTSYYLKALNIAEHLKLGNNVSNLMEKAEDEVRNILLQFDNSENQQILQLHNHEYQNTLDDQKSIFFTWNNENYSEKISQILHGKEVLLKADILKRYEKVRQVIKFKLVDVNFKAKDETKQKDVDELIGKFEISLTHQGDSYYLFNDKIYLINSNEFQRNFIPFSNTSETAELKLKNGDYTLSPYATWKISLGVNNENVTYDDLNVLENGVDLVLEGQAQWITPKGAEDWIEDENLLDSYRICDLSPHDINKRQITHRSKRNTEDSDEFDFSSMLSGATEFIASVSRSFVDGFKSLGNVNSNASNSSSTTPEINLIEQCSKNHSDTSLTVSGINLNCTLLLANYVLSKVFRLDSSQGSSVRYLSPAQERLLKVANLAAEVVPELNKKLADADEVLQDLADQPEWYQNIFQDVLKSVAREEKSIEKE